MNQSAEMLYVIRLLVSKFQDGFLTNEQENALHLARLVCADQPPHLHELANKLEDDEILQ